MNRLHGVMLTYRHRVHPGPQSVEAAVSRANGEGMENEVRTVGVYESMPFKKLAVKLHRVDSGGDWFDSSRYTSL